MQVFLALFRKDMRVLANAWHVGRQQSRFKQAFIGLFAIGLTAGLWRLFLDGFRFLSALGGVGTLIIQRLFALFFFSLAIMLLVSSVITSYAVIFRSGENPFLILSPLSHGRRILHQWLEITLISAWAFFFMIVPFIGAFVMHENLSLLFVLWTGLWSVPFVLLCCGAGALLTMAVVRWMPRFNPVFLVLGLVALMALWWWRAAVTATPERADDAVFMLARLIPGLRLAAYPLWPSRWVAEGILAFSRGNWMRGVGLLSVLISNLLMAAWLIEQCGQAWFYTGWQKTLAPRRRKVWLSFGGNSGAAGVTQHNNAYIGGILTKMLFFLRQEYRGLVLKDWRQMWRDPVQWTQGAVFFCLLAVYFFNLRNLNYHLLDPVWRNLIAFINIFSLAAIMCSFCSRFIYPQMSLEGHGCWILGLSPVSMGRVLITKFISSLAMLAMISIILLLVSTTMLEVPAGVRWIALLIAAAMSASLCALATGLGAIFLDLRQTNPTVIISSFGGTLNLALSLGYMIAAILPFATFHHWYYTRRIGAAALQRGVWAAVVWLLVVTAIAVATPLWLGRRSLLRREF